MQVSFARHSARVCPPNGVAQCKCHATPPVRPCRLQFGKKGSSDSRQACWRACALPQKTKRQHTRATYPEPETEKERSPLDYPQVHIQCRTHLQDVSMQVTNCYFRTIFALTAYLAGYHTCRNCFGHVGSRLQHCWTCVVYC